MPKVAVVTSTSPYRREMFDLTYKNQIEYCELHGCDSFVIYLEDGIWVYKKHEKFRGLFNDGYDIILYKDDDSLFTNFRFSIRFGSGGLIITKDIGGINGGVMVLNGDDGKRINELILENKGLANNEQELLDKMHQETPWKEYIRIVPQNTINSYRYDLYPEIGKLSHDEGQWQEGDFILHLPALTLQKRIEIIKQTKITK